MNAFVRRAASSDTRIQCTHHFRSWDNHLNRVIRAGVRLAANIAQDGALRRSLRRLDARLGEEIGDIRLNATALERAERVLDRLAVSYAPALKLIGLIYACSAISLEGDAQTAVPGFLFDMNRFFQALMGRFLADHLEGYRVQEEQGLTDMMRFMPGRNPRGRRAPRPRPDFIVTRGTNVWLLDAKYRDLWERDLPREMLYQLAIYALSQPPPATAAILFPTLASATDAIVEIRDPTNRTAIGYVALRPVMLSALLSSMRDGQQSAELARRLAFGGDPKRA